MSPVVNEIFSAVIYCLSRSRSADTIGTARKIAGNGDLPHLNDESGPGGMRLSAKTIYTIIVTANASLSARGPEKLDRPPNSPNKRRQRRSYQPPLGLKNFLYLSSTPLYSSASGGYGFLRVMLGHAAAYSRLSS